MGVRRNTITFEDARIVVAIAAVSGVLAALAGCRPTGSLPIDVVITGAGAGAITWLGASVPWWGLIAASGLAGVMAGAGGSLALLIVAWVALGGALWIAATRANRPPLRAAVVAIVVQVALRLEWEPFFGASALAATVILGLIVATGLQRRQRYVRRRVYAAGAAVVVVAAVAAAGFVIAFSQVRTESSRGYGLMLDGLEFVQSGQTERGAGLLREASAELTTASDGLGSLLTQPARVVPALAQNRNATTEILRRAADAAAAAANTLDQVDIDQLRVSDGVVNLAAFDLLEAPLTELEITVSNLRGELDEQRSGWLVGPLQDRFDSAYSRALQVERQAAGTAMLARTGPAMLGADGPRRYYIAFVNPAEARATGGFMGNWSEITIDQGRLSRSADGRSAELQRGVVANEVYLDAPGWFFERYGDLDLGGPDEPAGWNAFSNATIAPHGPMVGTAYTQLYEGATGRAVDGAFIVSPAGLAALLGVTGSIELPELGITLTSENTERFLLLDQYEFEEAEREDLLEAVSEATVERLLTATLPPPHEMAATLAPAALEGEMTAFAVRAEEQAFLEFVGIAGSMPEWGVDTYSDVLAITLSNASGNKIDSFTRREVEYVPVHDPDSGITTARLRVELHNDAPTTGYPDYVIGNLIDFPRGWNRLNVEIFSPLWAGPVTIDGEPVGTMRTVERGLNVNRLPLVPIAPGETAVIEVEFTGQLAPGWYDLVYRPQNLPLGDHLVVDGRSGSESIRFDGQVGRRTVIDALGARAWR